MTINGWIQIAIFGGIVLALVQPLGAFMTKVFNGERTFLSPILRPVEVALYRLCGVDESREQHWLSYTSAMLLFHVGGFIVLYGLLRLQGFLPFNPQGMGAVPQALAFNTSVSFISNTDWQNYGGESTLSYLVQMLGLTQQNFLSAATGIALAIALTRGFARASARTIGNFWVDLTRATLYVLLPICVIGTVALVALGVPQNLSPYVEATTLEGAKQVIAQGPVASQMMIKHLGTNGGGFFNANAAHPYENPNAVTNLVHMVAIFAIGAAMTNVFGRMVGNQRQGWAIFSAMAALFIAGVLVTYWAEASGTTALMRLGSPEVTWKARRCASASHCRRCLRSSPRLRPVGRSMRCTTFSRARRDDPTDQHPAWRDHCRRRRRRSLRHAAVCHPDDLRRRADGRTHAGICRQEDRGQGSQDGDARRAYSAAHVSRLDRAGDGAALRRLLNRQSGAARLYRDPLCLCVADR